MTTNITLNFVGEAPVEASKAGTVTKVIHEVEVTCKPSDLPNHIDVNIETLVNVEDKIFVKDLKVGKGVTIETHGEDPVAVVSAARQSTEDEDTIAEAGVVDMDSIEVEKKGKGEEDGEEGGDK